MNLRYVNGKDNGITYNMTTGTMSNSGQLRPTSLDPGHLDSPYTVYIGVWKDVFGPDIELGYAAVVPNTDGTWKPFSKGYGCQTNGNYYIVAYKVEDDGWNVEAEGTLSTN
ncbi:MAG: hypothetical protein FIA99_02900 [Ruminiclostridium sp.]|nr:hypothetical protein [Ruminiclostridium sp.]